VCFAIQNAIIILLNFFGIMCMGLNKRWWSYVVILPQVIL